MLCCWVRTSAKYVESTQTRHHSSMLKNHVIIDS